jgi:hypothetical protein
MAVYELDIQAEDLPEIFVLFYSDSYAPKKFTYLGGGRWDVHVLNRHWDWKFLDNTGTTRVLFEWEKSIRKFKIVWPEEYGE